MLSPTTPTPTTYTTIPISISALISRSFHNLTTTLSRLRPLPEFLSAASLPASLSDAASRFRLNAKHFSINYALLLTLSSALSLLSSPAALTILALVFVFWLLFYFFREDPLIVFGYEISNQNVLWGLIFTSLLAVWYTGMGVFNKLLVGFSVGVLLCFLHGAFKNPEGGFLDEHDAVSNGLVAPKSSNNGGIP